MPHPVGHCKNGLQFGRKQEGGVEVVRHCPGFAPHRPGLRGLPDPARRAGSGGPGLAGGDAGASL